jgi:hypothetical protein
MQGGKPNRPCLIFSRWKTLPNLAIYLLHPWFPYTSRRLAGRSTWRLVSNWPNAPAQAICLESIRAVQRWHWPPKHRPMAGIWPARLTDPKPIPVSPRAFFFNIALFCSYFRTRIRLQLIIKIVHRSIRWTRVVLIPSGRCERLVEEGADSRLPCYRAWRMELQLVASGSCDCSLSHLPDSTAHLQATRTPSATHWSVLGNAYPRTRYFH